MNEEESIEILCPVCSQPMDANEEVAECVNPMCNVYELETGTWYAISQYIEKMKARLTELEAVAQQANAGMVTDAEWYALSAESRHRLNVYALNTETLAALVLAHSDALKYTVLPDARNEMIKLARKIAPSHTTKIGFFGETPVDIADAPQYIGGSGYSAPGGPVTLVPGVREIFGDGGVFADTGDGTHVRFEPVDNAPDTAADS